MKRIRIGYCIEDLTACGAQGVVKSLATGLDPARFEVIVYAFKGGPIANIIERAGVTVRLVARNIQKFDLSLVWRLRKYLQRDSIDIVHTHLFGATLHGMVAARGISALFKIVTLHADREDNILQRVGYPFLFPAATCVIGVSQHASQIMAGRYTNLRQKLITIPNGIDIDVFSTRPAKKLIREKLKLPVKMKIVGAIGRLTVQKGFAGLLEAFAQLKKSVPEAHLVIIGEGELRSALQARADALNLGGAVEFLGSSHDVPELLQAMDLFVMSSLWEGMPLVLLEAMASGIPCVATAVGGIPEVVENEKEGLLVPPADSRLLAQAMTRLLTDGSLGQDLAAKALQKVRFQFSIKHMVREHEKLYDLIHRGQHISSFLTNETLLQG